jgi:hypothetical protein
VAWKTRKSADYDRWSAPYSQRSRAFAISPAAGGTRKVMP